MFPNNDEFMYRYSQQHSQEIRNDVESARDDRLQPHILRRRITVLGGLFLVVLTMVVMTLALGWWVL